MKLNKRVIASAALSVSLATSAVAPPPVAWADEKHVNCPQKFRAGSDFDGDVNAKVEKHLQRDCELTADQVSRLSIETKNSAKLREPGLVTNSTESRLKVNDVKVGDKKITGLVFLLPGEQATVQVTFLTTIRTLTQELRFDQSSAESDDTSGGKFVPFTISVPSELELRLGDEISVTLPYYTGKSKPKPVKVVVKSADNGNGRAPGGGAGEKPGKPHIPGGGADDNPPKPPAPGGGAGDNPRTGGGSSSLGSS
ncbi:intracellular motility protein A [Corynebacterium belfantii]|uniref:intracellular motility protein A n=1 Tax=Corynebacterium belfantii TaxID=2014537 RepID=UPI001F348EFB|nr:intracellular motility protein A [Corynebacterium belfantii]